MICLKHGRDDCIECALEKQTEAIIEAIQNIEIPEPEQSQDIDWWPVSLAMMVFVYAFFEALEKGHIQKLIEALK